MTKLTDNNNQQQVNQIDNQPVSQEASDSQMADVNTNNNPEEDTQEMKTEEINQQPEEKQQPIQQPQNILIEEPQKQNNNEQTTLIDEEMKDDLTKERLYFVKTMDENTDVWRWIIPNVSQYKGKKYSEVFTVANNPWFVFL